MLCAQSWEVSSFAQRRAFEQHQPMPSSCARDLWLLWEHLQGATSVYMVHTVTPNLSIKWSYQIKRAGREVAGKRWTDLVQDHCCLKNEKSWLQILCGHALCFPRHHISAVAVPASPFLIYILQALNAGENPWRSRSSSDLSNRHYLRGRCNAQGSLVWICWCLVQLNCAPSKHLVLQRLWDTFHQGPHAAWHPTIKNINLWASFLFFCPLNQKSSCYGGLLHPLCFQSFQSTMRNFLSWQCKLRAALNGVSDLKRQHKKKGRRLKKTSRSCSVGQVDKLSSTSFILAIQ